MTVKQSVRRSKGEGIARAGFHRGREDEVSLSDAYFVAFQRVAVLYLKGREQLSLLICHSFVAFACYLGHVPQTE